MKYKILIMLIMLIFIVRNQAQEIKETTIKENIFTSFKSDSGSIFFFKDFRTNSFPGQSYFNEFRYNKIFMSNFEQLQFDHFDKCLNDQYKYDLGVVRKYLGLTKNAAAILIGILSLL